jgi:4-amino-4-deoxy-L-arabinose transferase-like glycosyltransferase
MLTIVLHVALLARTWPHPDRFVSSTDSLEYLTIADNLLAGHGFSQATTEPYAPDIRRTPLFPLMLASVFAVGGRSLPVAAAVNVGIGLIATVMISLLVARQAGTRAGVATAAFLAVDLTTLAYRNLLLTESLFTTLLVAAVWALVAPIDPRPRQAAIAGLALGLAGLCRPIGLFLSPGLLPIFLFRARDQGWKQAIGQYAILNTVCGLVLGLWIARNAFLFGVFALTSLGGVNLYFHRAAYVAATVDGSDVREVRERLEREFDERSRGWSEREKLAWLSEHGRSGITAHPIVYIRETLGGLARMFSPERDEVYRLLGMAPFSPGGRLLWGFTWAHLAVLYACVMIGLVRGLTFKPAHQLLIVTTMILAYFIVLSGPEMYARFRMPLMPLLATIGGLAFRERPEWTA